MAKPKPWTTVNQTLSNKSTYSKCSRRPTLPSSRVATPPRPASPPSVTPRTARRRKTLLQTFQPQVFDNCDERDKQIQVQQQKKAAASRPPPPSTSPVKMGTSTTQLKAQVKNLQQQVTSKDELIATKDQQLAAMTSSLHTAQETIKTKDEKIKDLKKKLDDAIQRKRNSTGRSRPKREDLRDGIVTHVVHATNVYLFRTRVFIQDQEDAETAAKALIPYIPVELDMSEDDFIRDYSGEVSGAVGRQRNYRMQQGKAAAKRKS